MTRVWDVPVHGWTRVGDVGTAVEEAAELAGFTALRSASAALVATEMATNLLKHGGGGRILVETLPHAAPGRPDEVQVVAIDHGPGIPDLAAAFEDGASGIGSLGAGLGTCRRTADVFDIHSVPDRGTVALARIARLPYERPHLGGSATAGVRAGGVHAPLADMRLSGDAWTCWSSADVFAAILADGLGHGDQAAEASDAAVQSFRSHPDLPPDLLLRDMGPVLRPTRGAAVAAVRIDSRASTLEFAGVGNVTARLRTAGRWQHLVSRPGIVGVHRLVDLSAVRHPWSTESVLVMHSDGLPGRWQYSGDLERSNPAAIAAVLLRDAGNPARLARDDTTVAVMAADDAV